MTNMRYAATSSETIIRLKGANPSQNGTCWSFYINSKHKVLQSFSVRMYLIYKPLQRIDSTSFEWLLKHIDQEVSSGPGFLPIKDTKCLITVQPIRSENTLFESYFASFSQLKAVLCLFSQLKGERHPLFMGSFFISTIKQLRH